MRHRQLGVFELAIGQVFAVPSNFPSHDFAVRVLACSKGRVKLLATNRLGQPGQILRDDDTGKFHLTVAAPIG